MITYLGKFVPNLSTLTEPLRVTQEGCGMELADQQKAFEKIKETLLRAAVFRYYDINDKVTLSVDVPSRALRAILLQKGQPVAYTTKSLTQIEQNYLQIVKETFAICFACKKFHDYI